MALLLLHILPDLQVVEWVLAPVRAEWASPAWQAHLASPEAFIQQYTPVNPDGAGGWQVGCGIPICCMLVLAA